MTEDDAAMDEVDDWIRTQFRPGDQRRRRLSKDELNQRIKARLDGVRQQYGQFLNNTPTTPMAIWRTAVFWTTSAMRDWPLRNFRPRANWTQKIPPPGTAWPITTAKTGRSPMPSSIIKRRSTWIHPKPCTTKILPRWCMSFAGDAIAFYGITETQVFDKSLACTARPSNWPRRNFELASDYAESYYGIRPLRIE